MSVLTRKNNHIKLLVNVPKLRKTHVNLILPRYFNCVPSVYDDKNPAPHFISPNVQTLLKRLTRPDFAKVFRKSTNSGLPVLKTPQYKFLTSEELENEIKKAQNQAEVLLQMPPVVKIHTPIVDVVSKDPALLGYDTSTYLFTDITFGVDNEHRLIVQRDPDGTLHSCDHDIRKRLNQTYFPMMGRKIREPAMYTNEDLFNSLLERTEYEFILDRACIQYEPDEPAYQKVTSVTYQHIDSKSNYHYLRSTRHFGPMAFYLTWHQIMEGLLLELIQSNAIREAVLLIALRQAIHKDIIDGQVAEELVPKILQTPILHKLPDNMTEEDMQLDNKCTDCVNHYIVKNSTIKSQHELALQGFRETYQQLADLIRGLRKAHGGA